MKKFRRIISVIVALSTIMSISALCFIATAETANGEVAYSETNAWSLEDYISIGDTSATISNAPFGLDSKGSLLNTSVTTVNGVASITRRNDGKRAFSKSANGIIDITPADGTCSQVYFTAPKSGYYRFDVDLKKTDMSGLSSGTYVNNWTEVGPRTSLSSTFAAFGVTGGVNYKGAAIGNGEGYTLTGLVFSGGVTLDAGQVIVISINAGDSSNTDETQTTVNKFDVYFEGIENYTFNCKVGTCSPDVNTGLGVYNNDGVYDDGNFKLGSIFQAKPFKLVHTETVVNGWGNPMAGIDPNYQGFGTNSDTVGEGNKSGNWAWAFAKDDGDGVTDYHQIFITPQLGKNMDFSPKYAVPAVVMFTAKHNGIYKYDAQFKAGNYAAGVKLIVATGTSEYMMSMSEPNFYAESQFTTASSVHDFNGTVELMAGQTILFIAENPTAIVSPEVGIVNLDVTYMSAHECHEFEGADCLTNGTCVLCGETTGEKDSDNHASQEASYVNNGNGTHTVTRACCGTKTESHDFSSGVCVCGASGSIDVDGAEYVAVLSAPASWITTGGTGTVNINLQLAGAATEYASGEVIIEYDPNQFTFSGTSSSGVYVSPASYNGRLILMMMGEAKPVGYDFTTVAALAFTAKSSANLSSFVLKEAGFSTSTQAEKGSVITAQKYSSTVIPTTYNITLDPMLEGDDRVFGLTDYTFTAKIGGQSDYVITAQINGVNVTVNNNGDGSWTIPAAQVTGDIVITAAVKGAVNSPSKEYVTLQNGNKLYLILYERGADGPLENAHLTVDVDGDGEKEAADMLWSDNYKAYCYLVISNSGLDVDECTFAVVFGDGPAVEYTNMDINATENLDANDAQLVYNIYNLDYSSFNDGVSMEKFLRADFNNDKIVDNADVVKVVEAVMSAELAVPAND